MWFDGLNVSQAPDEVVPVADHVAAEGTGPANTYVRLDRARS